MDSIATGDFDNDGLIDIMASNWGRNTRHNPPEAFRLYFAPSHESPSVRVIEAYLDSQLNQVVPFDSRDSLTRIFPNLPQRYPTFASFSTATIPEILGDELSSFHEVRWTTLDSMLFLNRGSNFVGRALPLPAQFSPVFGIAVGDVDADGNEDLYLAQNFFDLKENSRHDAGRGLLLLGNGHGHFTACSSSQSGIIADGQGRGASFCDYDHDGRLDLAVGQNSGPTRLFHNQSSKSGLRVLLGGIARNPSALGASVRLIYEDGTFGPVHEKHAGEGYWSQADGAIVMGRSKLAKEVEVRLPGGLLQRGPLQSDSSEITIRPAQ